MHKLFCLVIVFASLGLHGLSAEAINDGPSLIKRANAWKPGRPIPPGLLIYRDVRENLPRPIIGDPLPSDTDTWYIFGGITNYKLCLRILFTPCDQRIFDRSVRCALTLAGPTRFYGDLCATYRQNPRCLREPRHANLNKRAGRSQVMFALMLADGTISHESATAALKRTILALRSGTNWEQAAQKAHDMHPQQIVNLGEFILERGCSKDVLVQEPFPAPEIRRLFKARVGESFIDDKWFDDKRTKSSGTRLYWVKDVYAGNKAGRL